MTAFFITTYKIPSRKILIGLKIILASQSAHLGRGQGERLISTLWLSVNDSEKELNVIMESIHSLKLMDTFHYKPCLREAS